MTQIARSGRERGNVFWMDPRHVHNIEARSFAASIATFLVFVFAFCVAAEILAEAIIAWMGHDRGFALRLILASSFL